MDKKVIYEVLSRLIGYTNPCGDDQVDKLRRINNYNLMYVTIKCIETLIENANLQGNIGKDSQYALKLISNAIRNTEVK